MNRSEMMVTRAARNIQKRIPQIWKEMELDLPDEYWGVMGDFGDMLKAQRDRVYDFESRVFDEMWEETEKFDKSEQQKLYKLTDLMLKKFLKSPAAKHPTTRLNQRPAGTLRYFPSLDNKKNPARRPKESPLYVKYLSLMSGEEPFMMQGTKYEYVWAEYPGGVKDIGVYSYANDLVYSYDSFRQMMNLPNPLTRRKGESVRDFTSRCMSEEKASFPEPKQRIAVCLSKSRKRNPVYDTGSDE